MAKTLTEQTRLWGATATDPSQFGDGAPVHSHVIYDIPKMLNNLQGPCEPGYQFGFDVSAVGNGAPIPRCRVSRTSTNGSAEGVSLLAQMPVHVRPDASRMYWSAGIYRSAASGESTITTNVRDVTAYLAAGPCVFLLDPVASNPTPSESTRLFDPSYISGPYSSNAVDAVATSDSGTSLYTKVLGQFFTDFAPRGLNNINDRNGDAWAFLILTADFNTMAVGEQFRLAELAIWFDYL